MTKRNYPYNTVKYIKFYTSSTPTTYGTDLAGKVIVSISNIDNIF